MRRRILHIARSFVRSFVLLLLITASFRCAAEKVQANRIAELSFSSTKLYNDPFNDLEVNAVVTKHGGDELRIPAFWAGGQTWRFRFSSPHPGDYTFRTECSDTNNSSLHGVIGTIEVTRYTGTNSFFVHGPVRVSADHRHFEHEDGKPFLWLADTWWMGFCKRLSFSDFQTLTRDRVEKGFNVVQIIAGLYPDMPAFDPRGESDAGFPWTTNYSRVNPSYFDVADKRIAHLVESGIAPCVVGGWGYHLPWIGTETFKKHWRYLVARYGAYPGFWCIAGEGIMPFYLSKNRDGASAFQKKALTEVASYVRQIDAFHHPISIHPTDMARHQVEDPLVIDFDMLQTGHSDRSSIPNTIQTVRASRAAAPVMPVINSEVCYEGILETCWDDVQRFMIWSCLLSGTAGHTYGANGIWQVNQQGKPYGKSPGGNSWGDRPWDEAMRLPGSGQSGIAKRFLEGFEWWKFEPHPEWASYRTDAKWGNWIWFPEGDAAKDAPVEKRYFRRVFQLSDVKISAAWLQVAADDFHTAFINGVKVSEQLGWNPPKGVNVAPYLQRGRNVLAIMAENRPANVQLNPAGLLCTLHIDQGGKRAFDLYSDNQWKCSRVEASNWQLSDFNDRDWQQASVIGPYGVAPWGQFGDDQFMVPYAAGIPGRVRVIYLPLAKSVEVSHLEAGVRYAAAFLNPRTGELGRRISIRSDDSGKWKSPYPPFEGKDSVLVLTRQ